MSLPVKHEVVFVSVCQSEQLVNVSSKSVNNFKYRYEAFTLIAFSNLLNFVLWKGLVFN